jgi:hypothetical protein
MTSNNATTLEDLNRASSKCDVRRTVPDSSSLVGQFQRRQYWAFLPATELSQILAMAGSLNTTRILHDRGQIIKVTTILMPTQIASENR